MSEDLVQLSWNDFDTNVNDTVKNLRKDCNLSDVTLVCEDGEIRAHRFILSACSPFFSRVVGKTYNHVHPLLYLRGVSTKILANILDYMYLGVVKMAQEDLSEMLNIASDLKVCGLTTTSLEKGTFDTENYLKNPFKEVGEKKKLVPFKTDKTDPLKISNKKSNDKLDSDEITTDNAEDGEVFFDEEEENLSDLGFQEEEKELSLMDMELEAPPHDETNKDMILDGMLDNIVMRRKSESSGRVFYECRVCKKTLKTKNKLRIHAEMHVTGFTHKCHYCGRLYKTRPSLAFHVYGHKKELKSEQAEFGNISA